MIIYISRIIIIVKICHNIEATRTQLGSLVNKMRMK